MNYHVEEATIERFTRELIETPSPVSYYEEIHPLMERIARQLGYTITYDRKRTAYIRVEGEDTSKTICVGAHLDTIGLMIRHINDNGTLALRNLGGINYNNIEGCSVQVHTRGGTTYTGLLACTSHSTHVFDDARSAVREESNMMVILDELVYSAQEVRALGIEHGDIISIDPQYHYTESGFIKSRFLDDKISASALMGVLQHLKEHSITPAYDLIFMMSTYEEVGHGMAHIPSCISELIAVDMGCIGLDLACSEQDVSICAKDSSGPYDYEMTSRLIELAKQEHLNYAVDIYPMYGSDVSAALRGGSDIRGALIGPGVHASHGMERTHYDGVENTMKLILAYIS